MWSVSPQGDPRLPISHVPKPPTIHTIAVAHRNRDSPASVTRNPSTSAGPVLAARCAQLACSSGAKRIPHRPSVSSGRMPLSSSRCPLSWSNASTTYSSATKLRMVAPPTTNADRFFGCRAAVWPDGHGSSLPFQAIPAASTLPAWPRTLRATGRDRSVFRRPTRRRSRRPPPRGPGSRPPRRPPRWPAGSPARTPPARRPAAPPRWRRWPARTPCRRRTGCARAGCCGPARRGRRSRPAGTPPGSARRRSRRRRSWCSARSAATRARPARRAARRAASQPELVDQVAQPRQTGGLVDHVARGVDHHQRTDRHPGRQRHRRRPDAAFEHPRARPHPGADRADGDLGAAAVWHAHSRTRRSGR